MFTCFVVSLCRTLLQRVGSCGKTSFFCTTFCMALLSWRDSGGKERRIPNVLSCVCS